ncbi:hypothetical protein L6164_031208 [Bauhinia variegata]|uniref:Uncharacterized protein n=1 Tax=Bauhinia variegata TaxID=167791 RepID=A0ACB9LF52_BAUVA|nr:hypothetical protein L6164_031208 [Bauhinia variegata]
METLDEYKHGFPSQGLATISNKWWGDSESDDGSGINRDKAEVSKHGDDQLEGKATEVDKEASETETGKDDSNVEGAAVLTAVRKRAAEEGRALKLGVFRGCGAKKLGKRERMLLLNIFQSSLPGQFGKYPSEQARFGAASCWIEVLSCFFGCKRWKIKEASFDLLIQRWECLNFN